MTAGWSPRMILMFSERLTEAFPWAEAPRYVIRDRDCVYGAAVTHRLRAMGIRDWCVNPLSAAGVQTAAGGQWEDSGRQLTSANSRGWRPNGTRGSIFYLSRRYTIWEGGPPAVGAGFVTRNSSPTISNGRVCTVPSKFGYVLPSNRIVNVFLSSSTV
jgi:hypothetical protein